MRAILAGLFVFASMLSVVGIIGANYPDDDWPWWAMPLIVVTPFCTGFLALFLFNKRGLRPNISGKSLEEQIADLETAGLIQRDSYRATRAFEVEEFEDEGTHYYVELEDGRVLYLNGQYLYDYEPMDDDPDVSQPRSFPCTEFETVRHRTEGGVISITCRGHVLTPEIEAPHYTKADFKAGLIPEDGQILTDSYDEIKRRRIKS